jgi:hypothetical protein
MTQSRSLPRLPDHLQSDRRGQRNANWVLSIRQSSHSSKERYDEAGSKVKMLILTAKGQAMREKYGELVRTIEEQWRTRFGDDFLHALRQALEGIGAGTEPSLLFLGLLHRG